MHEVNPGRSLSGSQIQIGMLWSDQISVSSLGFIVSLFTALAPHPLDNVFINMGAFARHKARH